MDNKSYIDDDQPINQDSRMYTSYQVIIVVISVLILLMNGLCLVALNRTHNTPAVARFLSSALLVFDFITNLLYTVRKTVSDGRINLTVQFLAIGWSFLAYVNIAVMSVERLIVFQWPNFYLRRVTCAICRLIAFTIWVVYIIAWTLESGSCTLLFETETKIRVCFRHVVLRYVVVTFPLSALISCCCLAKILIIIRTQANKLKEGGRIVRNHKSTIVVMFCCINYVITMVMYVVIMLFTLRDNLKRRILLELLMIVNGLVDISVYVLWYKECRLELLKLLAKLFPGLNRNVEKLRIKVFNIAVGNDSQT
mgnify:CR=1 FL=1